MVYGKAGEGIAFSTRQQKSQLGLTTLHVIQRQLGNHLYFSHVPSPSPLLKLHYNQAFKSIPPPHLKEHAPASGYRFNFLWVFNMDSELSSRKDRCTNMHMQIRWGAEGKTAHHYSSLFYLDSWEDDKDSSYNFNYLFLLLTYSLNSRCFLQTCFLPKEVFGNYIIFII